MPDHAARCPPRTRRTGASAGTGLYRPESAIWREGRGLTSDRDPDASSRPVPSPRRLRLLVVFVVVAGVDDDDELRRFEFDLVLMSEAVLDLHRRAAGLPGRRVEDGVDPEHERGDPERHEGV